MEMMPNDEVEMMRDAFLFLRDHNEVPAAGEEEEAGFWERVVRDARAMLGKWRGHGLMVLVLAALYEYLRIKPRKGGGSA